MSFVTYADVRQYRNQRLTQVAHHQIELSQFHDDLFHQVLKISLRKISEHHGPPPSSFSFFVMGSAGRVEQSVWSDQDHGIIYHDQDQLAKGYFLSLGKEITEGLLQAGYPYCDGGVMASNPLWCKSFSEWQQQIENWVTDSTWESIRHLLIFIDGRPLYGDEILIHHLKMFIYQLVEKEQLLGRIYDNTIYHKKGIGFLGQLLVETHGENTGYLNVKETALFPYVNMVRLLAIKHSLMATSTLSRLDGLSFQNKELYKHQFSKLLNYRLMFGNHTNYHSSHFIPINQLTKTQKKELKEIIKNGEILIHTVKRLIEKENKDGEI